MFRRGASAVLIGLLAACGSEGIEHAVKTVESKRLGDGSFRVVVEVTRTGNWTWKTLAVGDAVVGWDGGKVSARVTSPIPATQIPEVFRLEFRTEPIGAEARDPVLHFSLEVEAERDGGASSAGGTWSHEVLLTD